MSEPRAVVVATPATVAPVDELQADELVRRLRDGDASVFRDLVDAWSPAMLRVAQGYVANRQSAEDAVQDAWLGFLRGLAGFEGRASLRSWTFTILVNRAKERGVREARTVPTIGIGIGIGSGSADADVNDRTPTVDASRFRGANDPHAGHWTSIGAPSTWNEPETRSLDDEIQRLVEVAVGALPTRQRDVLTLRDVHGFTAAEACTALGLSAQNQRVLLHRARAAVRARLEEYYRG